MIGIVNKHENWQTLAFILGFTPSNLSPIIPYNKFERRPNIPNARALTHEQVILCVAYFCKKNKGKKICVEMFPAYSNIPAIVKFLVKLSDNKSETD